MIFNNFNLSGILLFILNRGICFELVEAYIIEDLECNGQKGKTCLSNGGYASIFLGDKYPVCESEVPANFDRISP